MQYLLSGHSLALDEARCNGCGRCVEVCPHAVFTISRRKAVIASRGACMECGACRTNCAPGAIQVSSGVGCAAAVLTEMLGRKPTTGASCACG